MPPIEWQCSCGDWSALSRLFFCRHCSALRCHSCASLEIDCTYCPHCLENIPPTEARGNHNLCTNSMCHRCPLCFVTLSVRAVGDQSYLVCSFCRWSSRVAGIPDQSTTVWPQHDNPNEKFLRDVLAQLERFALVEKQARDKKKFNKRRSNLGTMFADRFGMQDMISARRKKFEEPVEAVSAWEATSEVPQLPESIWKEAPEPSKIPTLEQQIRQPLAGSRPLYPLRIGLLARRIVRCRGCGHNLVKFEYSPMAVKFKLNYFARYFVPEIRLSKEIMLDDGSIFLTVSNESQAKTDVVVYFDGVPGSADCLTPAVEFTLPVLQDNIDSDAELPRTAPNDNIVFRRRNCVGLRIDIQKTDDVQRFLHLMVKHRNETTSFEPSDEWRPHRLRVAIP